MKKQCNKNELRLHLGTFFKKYAYTNDIQKMIYLVLKYANIEFDFDRDIDPPEIKLKIYQLNYGKNSNKALIMLFYFYQTSWKALAYSKFARFQIK